MQFISEHPSYSLEYLSIDQRIENCYQKLNIIKDVCFLFVSDEALREINKQSLNHDYYTDILTFDFSEDEDFTHSEVYISLDRVAENAEHYNSLFVEELHRVIIHGLLHLAGHNDKTEAEKLKMTQLEDHYLDLQRST